MTTTTRGPYWLAKSSAEKLLEKMILDTLSTRDLQGWTVIFSRESNRLGFCSYGPREIGISRKVILTDWAQAVDTAMHEVAHAIAGPGAAHGPRWAAIAKELGAQPRSHADYVNRHQTGEQKTVRTSYGPVAVTVGRSTVQYPQVGEIKVIEIQRKYFIGETDQGARYRLPVDRLHPNCGDSEKVAERTVTLRDRRGNPVSITLGKSFFIHRGVRFVAVEPRSRNVIAVDSKGSRLLVPVEFLKTD